VPKIYAQFYAQRASLAPIYTQSGFPNPLKPRSGWV